MAGIHHDPERFRQALAYTASTRGFGPSLVEKDYYCSLILSDLAGPFQHGLVFKGGTCLSKVHADFYRLSEDLDFVISIEPGALPRQRRKAIAPLKEHLPGLNARLTCLYLSKELTGADGSRQYNGLCSYHSVVTGHVEAVKLQIGLRELVLEPAEQLPARTLLTDPLRNEPVLGPILVHALSFRETYAEKFRAALSRRQPAIRDYYDIDHAIRSGRLDPNASQLLDIIRRKLAVPRNAPVNLSEDRLAALRPQVDAQLKPVLRSEDFEAFDLDRAFSIVAKLAARL